MRREVSMSATVKTVAGTGVAGNDATCVNDPYGVVVGPDGALYFCEVGNQQIRRLDLQTGAMSVIAGNGQRAYAGDGGPAGTSRSAHPGGTHAGRE